MQIGCLSFSNCYYSAEFFIENALHGTVVIKSSTKAVKHCSLKHLGDCTVAERAQPTENRKKHLHFKKKTLSI